jgi:8-oxo-dGTP diphosphatase
VVLGRDRRGGLHVLAIRRKNPPFKGRWCLPGGFVDMGESLERAAIRELREETGVRLKRMEQLHAFGHPKRSPHDRIIAVAYCALVELEKHPARGGDDAEEAAWLPLEPLPKLGFDHNAMLAMALERLLPPEGEG